MEGPEDLLLWWVAKSETLINKRLVMDRQEVTCLNLEQKCQSYNQERGTLRKEKHPAVASRN